MSTVLIAGGSGLIGKHLSQKLIAKGFKVSILSRNPLKLPNIKTYHWDMKKKLLDERSIEEAEFIINLSGENIGDKRWSAERKKLIIDSRIGSTLLIFDKVKERKIKPRAFISASAVGYYGTITSNKTFTESDPAGNDFLAETCKEWEQAADKFKELHIRTVKLRTGVVLTKHGGALSRMTTPVTMGLGSALGSGKQYLPWIHIDDLCEIYIKAIEDINMEGAYNAVAPEQVTNREFTRTLAVALAKPFWLPNVPAPFLKLLFGEMADILLKGSRISSDKITTDGFVFRFAFLKEALNELLPKESNLTSHLLK